MGCGWASVGPRISAVPKSCSMATITRNILVTKNILVTGGAGYTGSVLVGLLLSNNYLVIVLDNLCFGAESLLSVWHHENFKFIKGDITSSDTVAALFSDYRIDAVVHLAAIVGDPACARQPALAERVNLDASLQLLELAARRFIFASTCSNYGKMPVADGYVTETSPLAPVSLYSELKVKFENAILSESVKRDSFCPTVLRFATVYGVSPRMRFDLTVNEFTKELALGRELYVFGERFWRPYCHVYDYAQAILMVLNSEEAKVAYNVLNVGATEENYQKQMIVHEIGKFISDAKARVKYVHKNEDPRDYRVSFEKIRAELGFTVFKRVPDGIREIKALINDRVLRDPDDAKYRNS
jgi:nucleoside-diphosphate-sugar epimerase